MLVFICISILILVWGVWGGILLDTVAEMEDPIALGIPIISFMFIVISFYAIYILQSCNIIDIF